MEGMNRRGLRPARRLYRAAQRRTSALAAVSLAVALPLAACTSSPPRAGARAADASASLEIGRAYPFSLLIHCGVPVVEFGGRAWKPVPPVPTYPGPRPENGVTTYTGYIPGTMTLVNVRTLRFVADASAVASPFSVTYAPEQGRAVLSPCS